jgi:putative ABC transport system ATP-binding protein
MTATTADAVVLRHIRFGYRPDSPVLDIADLQIGRGERIFIHGPSGSGKTTLLGLLAGVLQANSGTVELLGTDVTRLTGAQRDAFRALHIGYIFQMFNLIPYLSVLENITLPCRMNRQRRARLGPVGLDHAAREMATRLEIGGLAHEPVTDLSVGQQQRVAAARALLGAPEIVIADEPTSSLDTDRREAFLSLLFETCREAGSTLIFVSHDRTLMPLFDRGISLPDVNTVAVRS